MAILHNTANDPTYIGVPEDPIQLYQEFTKHGNKIRRLVNRRVLQQDQVDLLLPPNDNKTDSTKFDVTLIVILIINFTTLPPPLTGWKDKHPLGNDKSKGASVIRGRQWRNYVHHTEPKDIDQAEFNKKWLEGTQIISDLGYQYDTNRLKMISLDPKHELVLKSLFSFMGNLQIKQNLNTTQIADLTQQLNKIENEVKCLRLEKKERILPSTTSTGSTCLQTVLEYISKEIKDDEAQNLVKRLNFVLEGDLVDKLESVPWKNIKAELEMLGRADMVESITKNTLITKGLQNASNKLREEYKIELIKWLVEQPLSSVEKSQYIDREDNFVDVIVLPFDKVDEEFSNSDRDFLMKQNLLKNATKEKAVDKVIEPEDELVFLRGVAGIGKSTLIDMFTLKWAKNELVNSSMFDFVFKFTCRELNQISNQFKTLEELLKLMYPKIFDYVTLGDLAQVSDRVLIVVDGLDELKDLYKMDGKCTSSTSQGAFTQVICDLVNPKSVKSMKNHKTIMCGRPKACEFLKNQFTGFKIKTVEVCGFSPSSVDKYVHNFFGQDHIKIKQIQEIIASSYNLNVMSTVPVFLWVICNVYSEDVIKSPVNTNTELYFYTCLVLIRNHYQGHSGKYKNLIDIINDKDIIGAVYLLMVLSVKTYMESQVLFTDEDMKNLNCPVHLEQTGFIVKYCENNIAKAIYQFRHMVLQEFFCGMYLSVTKGISPFLSNRELSSCLPTILGIDRIIREKDNATFCQFYKALQTYHEKHSKFFGRATSFFKSRSYKAFIKNSALKENADEQGNEMISRKKPVLRMPSGMAVGRTLCISDDPDCREFLDLLKEASVGVDAPSFDHAKIRLIVYKDFRNILNLLNKLNVSKIKEIDIRPKNLFDESGDLNVDILQLYDIMIANSPMQTAAILSSSETNDRINCKDASLFLYYRETLQPINIRNIVKLLEKSNIFKIRRLDIKSTNFFDEYGIMDKNILKLYEMTAEPLMETFIHLYSLESASWMQSTNKNARLHFFNLPFSPISLPDSIKTTTKNFYIEIEMKDVLFHDAVLDFLEDLTNYAVDKCKHITFRSHNSYSSINDILGNRTMIDRTNLYIDYEYIRM